MSKEFKGAVTMEDPPAPIADMTPDKDPRKWKLPRTRKGRKGVTTYVSADTHRTIARLCIDQDKTQQELMHEAINMMLKTYGKHPD